MLEKFASVQLTRFSLALPFWDVVLQGPGHSWETSKQFSPVLGEAMCHVGGSWSRLLRGKPRLALAARLRSCPLASQFSEITICISWLLFKGSHTDSPSTAQTSVAKTLDWPTDILLPPPGCPLQVRLLFFTNLRVCAPSPQIPLPQSHKNKHSQC